MTLLYGILWALWGGALYRWRGASTPYKKFFPRPFNQIIFALPYSALCLEISWACAIIVLVVSTLGVLTGHGRFMDLGTWHKRSEDERLEFFIKPLFNRIPEYWYDALGLAVTGIAITVASGLSIALSLSPAAGALIIASGFLKALAYIIAHRLKWGTEGGEVLTGAFLYASLYVIANFYLL